MAITRRRFLELAAAPLLLSGCPVSFEQGFLNACRDPKAGNLSSHPVVRAALEGLRADRVWDAVTNPEFNAKYGYRSAMNFELRPGGAFKTYANPQMRAMGLPEVIIDGEVLECSPPNKLVRIPPTRSMS